MTTTEQNDINKLKVYFKSCPQKYSVGNLDTLHQDTDGKTVLKILGHFSDNLLTSSIELGRAVEANDAETLWKIAHKLKSTAQLLGFTYFCDLSKGLTQTIKGSDNFDVKSNQVESYFKEINKIYSDLRDLYPNLKQFI